MFIHNKLVWCSVFILGFSPQLASGAGRDTSKLIAAGPTNIPGLALRPGSYSIHVVDHLGARYIVRVDGPKRVNYSFLALENPEIPKPATPGRVTWNNPADGKQYLRGWLFSGEPAVLEFVYPKAEAVAIAKSNQAQVPAVDPASEGRPPLIKGLSKSDLELVTLWVLTPTHVGPGDTAGGIEAQRYTQVASAAAPKPPIGKLPQTASNLPLIALTGMFSLLVAFIIRMFRPASVCEG